MDTAVNGAATVLVVDDIDALRSLLVIALEAVGHAVLVAPDGTSALTVARETRPDVVLLDLALPDIDGLAVLSGLKADPLTAAAPVLIVTARSEPSIIAESLERGAHDHVAKPFRIAELLARVEAAVRVKREHDRLSAARSTLRNQVDFIEAVMDTIDTVVVVTDPAGSVVRFNRSAELLSGWTEDDIAGRVLWETGLLPAEDGDKLRQLYQDRSAGDPGRAVAQLEVHWRARDGRLRVLEWADTPLLDGERFAFGIGAGTDVTNLREADRRLHACLDVMPDAIVIVDAVRDELHRIVDFQLRYANTAAEHILPPQMLEIAAQSGIRQFLRKTNFEELELAVERGVSSSHVTTFDTGKERLLLEYSVSRFNDGAVVGVRDVTELHAAQERLAWAATHDALTGLASRRLLSDRLHHALAQRADRPANLVGVLFVDLDRFKDINDDLGHAAGDQLLQAVAAALTEQCRPGDTVARFGGDEFVIVAEGLASAAEVEGLAGRIEAALTHVQVEGRGVLASIGHAVARPGDDADTILRLADQVMYEKKRPSR